MFSPLAMAVTLALTLTQPGRIIEESELPPPGERPAQSAPEATAPEPDTTEPRDSETPAERRTLEDSEAEKAPNTAEQTQDTEETPRPGGRVMAFWMIHPDQANP